MFVITGLGAFTSKIASVTKYILSKYSDAIIATSLFVISVYAATALLNDPRVKGWYYQRYYAPAVMWACGKEYGNPAAKIKELDKFLLTDTDNFSCAHLPQDLKIAPISPLSPTVMGTEKYRFILTAMIWKFTGVSWSKLNVFYALFYAASVCLAYFIFRTALHKLIALPLAIFILASSQHLRYFPHFRDFAKEPFYLFMILGIILMARGFTERKAAHIWGAICGLILGVGIGFRMDLYIMIPPMLVSIVYLSSGSLKNKLVTSAIFLLSFLIAGYPIISASVNSGANGPHVILMGLAPMFTGALAVPSIYETVLMYNDTHIVALINSYAALALQDERIFAYPSASYDKIGWEYFSDIVFNFPADIIVRLFAAVIRSLTLPFHYLGPHSIYPDQIKFLEYINDVKTGVGDALALGEYSALYIVGAIMFLGKRDIKLGLTLFVALIYLAGYSMLQFHPRHYFHLEFITLLGFGVLIQAVLVGGVGLLGSIVKHTPHDKWMAASDIKLFARNGVIFLAVTGFVCIAPLKLARIHQQRNVEKLVSGFMKMEVERVDYQINQVTDKEALIVSDKFSGEYTLADKNLFSKTDFIEIVFNGEKCSKDKIDIRMKYLRDHDFSNDFTVRLNPNTKQVVKLITPVFDLKFLYMNRPSLDGNRLEGIAVDPSDAGCIGEIYRIKNPKAVPFIMHLQIPPDWRDLPLYQKFQWEP